MSKTAIWLSDIHLNFLEPDETKQITFFESIRSQGPDLVLISGDIGESGTVCRYLQMMDDALDVPIYFVLGNHDYYYGSISAVRNEVAELVSRSDHLTYLTGAGVVEITPTTCLIGHDGWSDGQLGDYLGSTVQLNDYLLIKELTGLGRSDLLATLQALGDEAAEHLRRTLREAMSSYRQILVVTHVPPFREACWHEGRISDDDYLPHFSCKATGDVLREAATSWPDRKLTVLCGHSHGSGESQILNNLTVLTAEAEYGRAVIQRKMELE